MTEERQGAEAEAVVAPVEAPVEPVTAPAEENGEEKEKTKKRARAKMTLRIPDDEVSRPSSVPADARGSVPDERGSVPDEEPPSEKPGSIIPTPIINVGTPSNPAPPMEEIPAVPPPPAIAAPGSNPDDSWTPYQPAVTDARPVPPPPASDPDAIDVAVEEEAAAAAPVPAAIPSAELSTSDFVPDSADVIPDSMPSEPLELDEAETHAKLSSRPPPPPVPAAVVAIALPPPAELPAESAAPVSPLATDAPPVTPSVVQLRTKSEPPPAPSQPIASRPTVPEGPHHPSRPPASALVDESEAANIQEIEPDRMSEPPPEPVMPSIVKPRTGVDEAELAAEDVVSVESVRPPMTRSSNPPPTPSGPHRPPLLIVPPIGGPPSPLAPPPIGETAPKRKGKLWWEELFGDDFIRTMAKISDEQIAAEVDFVEDSLGVAKGGALLDLACGTGRHAIELARRGYQIVGFDLSLAMLARAADEAQERDQKINFVQGDMREMTFENTFDGIYCWNSSFGFFEEDRNAAVIGKIHKALRAGGQFLLDVVNRDFIVNQSPSLVWFEGDGCVCMDEMQMDWITSRMRVKRTMMLDDGRSKEIEYSIRVYSLHELGKLMHDQGFRIAEVSGRTATPGVFFGSASPRTLILAEKKT